MDRSGELHSGTSCIVMVLHPSLIVWTHPSGPLGNCKRWQADSRCLVFVLTSDHKHTQAISDHDGQIDMKSGHSQPSLCVAGTLGRRPSGRQLQRLAIWLLALHACALSLTPGSGVCRHQPSETSLQLLLCVWWTSWEALNHWGGEVALVVKLADRIGCQNKLIRLQLGRTLFWIAVGINLAWKQSVEFMSDKGSAKFSLIPNQA